MMALFRLANRLGVLRGRIPLSGAAVLRIVKDAAPGAYEDLSFVACPCIVLYAA